MAILKLISAVGIFIKCSTAHSSKIGTKKSTNKPKIFENNIIKNITIIYIFTHFFSDTHKISSKNSYVFSNIKSKSKNTFDLL